MNCAIIDVSLALEPPQVLELDPGNAVALKTVERLLPVVTERREKLKEEMMGGGGGGVGQGVGGPRPSCVHPAAAAAPPTAAHETTQNLPGPGPGQRLVLRAVPCRAVPHRAMQASSRSWATWCWASSGCRPTTSRRSRTPPPAAPRSSSSRSAAAEVAAVERKECFVGIQGVFVQ